MAISIGLVSYGVAAVSYLGLAALLVRQWQSPVGPAAILSSILTAAWALIIAAGTLADYPPITAINTLELGRNAAWLCLLLQLNSLQSGGDRWRYSGWDWRPLAMIVVAVIASLLWVPRWVAGIPPNILSLLLDLQLSLWLLLSVFGLLLLEQLYRNSSTTGKWSSKFICLGVGCIFAYDFFMYAEALLFRQLDSELWRARGVVLAVAVPWLAVGMVRHQASQIDLHVSRQVVFHSFTLLTTGLYLFCMALIGYYIRFAGGDWGGVLRLAFFASGSAALLSVLFSGRVRANLRVMLDKHFFSYRYDYREEWLKFTQSLAGLSENVPQGIIEVMGQLVGSSAGLLYADQNSRFTCVGNLHTPALTEDLGSLADWVCESGWVIDLQEWRDHPENYAELKVPAWLAARDDLWLVVPLTFHDSPSAILILNRAELKDSLNWEDRDLLKTAGRQAAAHLAQYLASNALIEARQFDAFNRLSAYVVHDLKNVLAQQSLLLSNADKHKDNPVFVDDMLNTVSNSVRRMQRLMEQMRSGIRGDDTKVIKLEDMLRGVVGERSNAHPQPSISVVDRGLEIFADRERLQTVFSHLLQNAQEATDDDGIVSVRLRRSEDWAVVEVEDSGTGMSAKFIEERLFKPFDSTKGLTGMGIGAFESREYVRQLGGDIKIQSSEGRGSLFTVMLPVAFTNNRESEKPIVSSVEEG